QNYPNPFNPTTEIAFNLPAASNVELTVYDTMGRSVATLFSGNLNAGRHLVTFDASHLASGIYFYRIDADGFSDLKKMALLK
ncbi:T9SS type A sorting domain-containing protein, partial [bacterium]|nr:T9SS type A sorting domain-containing protein [bacterium]